MKHSELDNFIKEVEQIEAYFSFLAANEERIAFSGLGSFAKK